MALKNIFRLSKRRQGELVGQIFKFIQLYTDFFVPRTRVYLKDVAQNNDAIYWLENTKTGEVSSVAIVDPKFNVELAGVNWVVISHAISKIPNQIHNIIEHILGDYTTANIIIMTRELFATAMQLEDNYHFKKFSIDEIAEIWPEFASKSTDYFNLLSGNETIQDGCKRKGYFIYLKLANEEQKMLVKKALPKLAEKL
jgi:hypothetical protein